MSTSVSTLLRDESSSSSEVFILKSEWGRSTMGLSGAAVDDGKRQRVADDSNEEGADQRSVGMGVRVLSSNRGGSRRRLA